MHLFINPHLHFHPICTKRENLIEYLVLSLYNKQNLSNYRRTKVSTK